LKTGIRNTKYKVYSSWYCKYVAKVS